MGVGSAESFPWVTRQPSLGLGSAEIRPWVPRAVCPPRGFWLCPCCPLGPSQSFPVPGLTSEGYHPWPSAHICWKLLMVAGLTPGTCVSHLAPGDGRLVARTAPVYGCGECSPLPAPGVDGPARA